MFSFSRGSLIAGLVGVVVGAGILFGVLTWLDGRAEAGAADAAVLRLVADTSRVGEFVGSNRFAELQTVLVEASFDPAKNCPLQPDMAAIIGSIESESVVMDQLRFRPSELFRPPQEISSDLAALPDVALAHALDLFPEDAAGSLRGRAVHFYLRSRDLFELFHWAMRRARNWEKFQSHCSAWTRASMVCVRAAVLKSARSESRRIPTQPRVSIAQPSKKRVVRECDRDMKRVRTCGQ